MSQDPLTHNPSSHDAVSHDHEPNVRMSSDVGAHLEESTMRRILRSVGRVMALPLIGLIRFYQLVISPLTPPTCRYYPSCSAYALTSLRRFGPVKGSWLAIRRLLRCHPWAPGGVDHVPERVHATSPSATSPSATRPPPADSADRNDAADSAHSADALGSTGIVPGASQTPAHSSGRPTPRDKGLL